MNEQQNILIFGMGYSAAHFARRMLAKGWRVIGTSRSAEGRARIEALGAQAIGFNGDDEAISAELNGAIANASHVLVSAGPNDSGDPVLNLCRDHLKIADYVSWVGYLSTVGVYGNHDGAWVTEESECRPVSKRSVLRVAAENAWLDFGKKSGTKVQVFRLGGIYGPGSNTLEKLRAGKSRRINKPDQVFSRIHIEDIARVLDAALQAAMDGKSDYSVFNVVDNEPAPPQDVIAYGAGLLGLDAPPLVHFDDAQMTEMARSFYGENKRVSNARIREDLGVTLAYPTYREGLAALVETVG